MNSTGCDIHARYSNGCSECNHQPTRDQMCADLARAMGWIRDNGLWCNPLSEWKYAIPPNPFTCTCDSRELVVWLVTQSVEVQCQFDKILSKWLAKSPDDLRPLSLWYLTADLHVIAEAAWKAIQEK